MTDVVIACRARVADDCLDGQPSHVQFGPDYMGDGTLDTPLSEDGTYDGQTIICDPCYVVLIPRTPSGQGLHHELDAAIAAMKGDT